MNESLPITEKSNEITKDIDKSTSEEIIKLFSKTDKQLFNYDDNALYDLDILNRIESIAGIIGENRDKNNFKIILSGCGTSGRLAYIAAKSLNEYLNKNLCDYIIAGDDYALINSVEAVEDSPSCGYESLEKRIENLDTFIFIGITCGLSAPFVAGQIDYCLQLNTEKALAVGLIGFNPAELARKNEFKLKNHVSTFHQLIIDAKQHSNFYLLNPIVGPEPITGSSRMKSGSATKVILDLIFLKFLFKHTELRDLVKTYELLIDSCLYESLEARSHLASIIDSSSKALHDAHSISYLSSDMQIGVLGCVDASECIPTFGAEREDIRGFINYDEHFWNELKQFTETSSDSLIFKKMQEKFHSLKPIYENFDKFIASQPDNELNRNKFFQNCLRLFLIKLCLNSISTASFVKQGKTYENYMIDVKASNFKLYKRAIHIIKLLSVEEEAEDCLLKSIYSTNDLSNVAYHDYYKHIELAKDKKLIVSKAIIMNLTKCSYEEAEQELLKCSTVRTCIENLKNKHNLLFK